MQRKYAFIPISAGFAAIQLEIQGLDQFNLFLQIFQPLPDKFRI
jgi:hypothetical protein